uniref:Sulfotransferase n=1 Tax=Pelusios castaneus TaxID=367368 RepID=A0A8C8S3D4_9SAUR
MRIILDSEINREKPSVVHLISRSPTKRESVSVCLHSALHQERRMANFRKKFIDLVDKAMAAGATMDCEDLLFSYKGILYPTTVCSPEVFKALECFEARREDVILAGYPKSGTNWAGQILTDLVTTAAENTEDETNSLNDEELEEFPYLEIGDTEKYQRMEKLSSRRVILTHLFPHNLPESIFKNKAKILVLVRNPKDVATSFYHFTNDMSPLPSYATWDDFFTAFMTGKMPWGSYFDYICEWSKHVDEENVMTITYEELKENRALGVKKIAEFFGLLLTEEELQAVTDRSGFQAMKENAQKTHGAFGNILFRKGSVSDWKNLFTEDQNQEMDKTFEECLAKTKLGAKIKYELYCKA